MGQSQVAPPFPATWTFPPCDIPFGEPPHGKSALLQEYPLESPRTDPMQRDLLSIILHVRSCGRIMLGLHPSTDVRISTPHPCLHFGAAGNQSSPKIRCGFLRPGAFILCAHFLKSFHAPVEFTLRRFKPMSPCRHNRSIISQHVRGRAWTSCARFGKSRGPVISPITRGSAPPRGQNAPSSYCVRVMS